MHGMQHVCDQLPCPVCKLASCSVLPVLCLPWGWVLHLLTLRLSFMPCKQPINSGLA